MTAGSRSSRTPTAALILLAAGSGQRVGHATNKVLLPLAGRRVFTWSLDWTASLHEISDTVLVVRESDRAAATSVVARESPGRAISIVSGGSARHDSEWAGLELLAPRIRAGEIDVVVIHDAARPLAGTELFRDVITAAREHGGALPGRPVRGLLPRTSRVAAQPAAQLTGRLAAVSSSSNGSGRHRTSPNGSGHHRTSPDGANPNGTSPNRASPNGTTPNGTNPNGAGPNGAGPNGAGRYHSPGADAVSDEPYRPDLESLPGADAPPTVVVQTPQAFRARPLLDAYEAAAREGFIGSDTAACIERFADLDIACLPGEAHNIKITFPEDLFVAERLLARSGFSMPRRGGRSR